MSEAAVRIVRMHLRSAPGLRDGLEPLGDFAPGVNVIYGPNGSGKSTTLRLMQAALSPTSRVLRRPEDWAVVELTVRGETHEVVLRGVEPVPGEGNRPVLEEALSRDCRFRLRELLEASAAADYGRIFAEEAAGGLDLRKLADELGLGDRNQPRRKDRNELMALQAELRELENRLSQLPDARDQLERKLAEQKRLRAQASRADLLRQAQRHQENLRQAERAALVLAEFPTVLANLRGDEADELERMRRETERSFVELRAARRNWHEARRECRTSGWNSEAPSGILSSLEEGKNRLAELEREAQSLATARAESAEVLRLAREALGGDVAEDVLLGTDAAALGGVAEWGQRVEEYHGRAAALAELEANLGDLKTTPGGGLAEELQLLRDWLAADRADEGRARAGRIFLGLAAACLVVSGLAGIFLHSAGWIGLLGTAVALWGWFANRSRLAGEIRGKAEERLRRQPENWSRPSVHLLLSQLEQDYARDLEQAQRVSRWSSDLQARRSSLEELARKLEEERSEFARRFGFAPGSGPHSWSLLAGALGAWQEAYRRHAGCEEALARLLADAREKQASLRPFLALFPGFEIGESFSSQDLAGWIADLRDRRQSHGEAGHKAQEARREVRRLVESIRSYRRAAQAIYQRAGLPDAGENALRELLGQLEGYRRALDEVTSHRRTKVEAEEFFARHPELGNLPEEVLGAELAELGDASAQWEVVNQEIGALQEQLKAAARSTAAEEKRAAFLNLRAAQQAERAEMLASVAGHALARQVQDKVAAETVPQVQKRAGELLALFTRGACELRLQDREVRAVQPATGDRLYHLEELSDGTRAQLLIAVRLAFVEHGEKGWRLPLFIDEALANTDDDRSRRIIQALCEVAALGRQIFCFTSQGDEFGRWSAALEGNRGPEAAFLSLRRGFALPTGGAPLPPPERYFAPDPGELLPLYAERIRVRPALDPWMQSIGELPVLFLLDDPGDLHRLLEASITTWGSLARLGPKECGLAGGEAAFAQASRRAEFLYGVSELWRQGRGKPLTREILAEAGFSNTANAQRLDEAWGHAVRLGRDALRFCQAVKSGEISITGVGTKRIRVLRVLLEEKGFVVGEEPLEPGQVRIRAQNLGRRLGLDENEIARLLELFTAA